MKRHQNQSKSNQSKVRKVCKPILSGKISKKKPRRITKSKNVGPLKHPHATQMNLLDFPDEILLKFQSFLNYRSMCQFVETCTKLHQVYGDPSLWADMPVKRLKIANDGMEKLKNISRFASIKHINLDMDAISITPARLAEVIRYVSWRNEKGTSLASLNLKDAKCSTRQLRTVFSSMPFENSMKKLDLSENNLEKVPPKLLKEAICCVEDVNLSKTCLSTIQLEALFDFIPTKNILKKIDLSQNDLEDVSPKLFKEAICGFEYVNLSNTVPTPTQLAALFSIIPTKSILKKIDLSDNDLEEVSPELFKEAISCFEDVNLSETELTTTQLTALFSFLPTKNILKKIDLSKNFLDEVSPVLFKETICHFEDVNLSETELTTTQLTALFSFIPTKNILKKIDLSQNDLFAVFPKQFKVAICCLEDVNLSKTELTTTQITALFSFVTTKNILKKIDLSENNLEEISPKLFKEAVCCFEDVNLSETELTTSQLTALFSFIPTKNILKNLDLSCNDLDKISPELLSKAVCHIEDVNLERTRLTTEQLKALFDFIPTQNKLKRLDLRENNCNMKQISPNVMESVVSHLQHILLPTKPPKSLSLFQKSFLLF